MIDLLKRSLAPLTDEAWKEIDTRAAQVLRSQLTARGIVDFEGPRGWDFAAVNLGRLEMAKEKSPYDVPWGKRLVLPLVETRVPFQLDQMELDCVARGSRDPELRPLEDAARRIALFEEAAVYNGFEPGRIDGILPRSEHPPIVLPGSSQAFPGAVARAVETLTLAGIPGPFVLVLGKEAWVGLMQSGADGYPPQKIIREMVEGTPRMSPAIEGGVVLSAAKGNFELTVGQDFSVGYTGHDRDKVELYLTESFAFRVLEPRAAIRLEPTAASSSP
jgi:uncharacterized linocin/CFP29 family protein